MTEGALCSVPAQLVTSPPSQPAPSHSCFPLATAAAGLGPTLMLCSACCSCCARGYFIHEKTLSSWEGWEGSQAEHGDSVGKPGEDPQQLSQFTQAKKTHQPEQPKETVSSTLEWIIKPPAATHRGESGGVGSHATPAVSGIAISVPMEKNRTAPSLP